MDYRYYKFSKITIDIQENLADLHFKTISSLLTDLGKKFVCRYYQVAQADSRVIGLCAINSTGQVLGWVIGTPEPIKLNINLFLHTPYLILRLVVFFISNPQTIIDLACSFFSSLKISKNVPGKIELIYIGVSQNARGKGIARELIIRFFNFSKKKGYSSVILSVEKENIAAISLYKKMGFKIIGRIKQGQYERLRLGFSL